MARTVTQSWKGTWTPCWSEQSPMRRPARNWSTFSRRWTLRTRGARNTVGHSPPGCSERAEPVSGVEATYSPVYWPRRRIDLTLGPQHYDLATRALVVGILNRTTDSFYDHGAYFSLDRFFERADELRSEERRVGKECRSRWSPY